MSNEQINNSCSVFPNEEALRITSVILDSISSSIVVTDTDGHIIALNKSYADFLGVDRDAQIGKHVTSVIENTRMHIVAKTGVPEINVIGNLKNHEMLVHRTPLKHRGKVIGSIGHVLFKNIEELKEVSEKLTLLRSKVKHYEQELINLRATKYTFNSIIGVSDLIVTLKAEATKAALTDLPVMISGESGTGKELFAQAIHHASARKIHPFIRINCAAIPKDLLESELFGYEKGAFTGANASGKPGKLELAQQGTVFLDEIGDMPIELQPKLLRVLEEKEFERVGGTSLHKVDFRLIAATNRNLEELLGSGQFRYDLYYRLNVFPIHIPPLRLRREDIIPIAHSLLNQISEDLSLPEIKIEPEAIKILKNHTWPGNVRELANALEWAAAHLEGNRLGFRNLPIHLTTPNTNSRTSHSPSSLKVCQDMTEKEAICQALSKANYIKSRAADILGIHRTMLYQKMKKHNIPLKPFIDR